MNKIILLKALRKIKSNPKLLKKAKVFLIVGFAGFLLVGGLAIWAGLSAVKYLVATASGVVGSPQTQSQIKDLKSELGNEWNQIQFQPWNCWIKAQSLMTVQPWMERPVMDNLNNLKVACLEPQNQKEEIKI